MIYRMISGIQYTALDVLVALSPLLVIFTIFQLAILKLPKRSLVKLIKGIILSAAGLVLFLQGVHIGYLPIGELMGKTLGSLAFKWILIPVGLVLGFAVTLAEPAVRVMTDETDKVTGGYVNKKIMILTLCTGVSVSVALSMARIVFGISLWYFIIPGYAAALIMAAITGPVFTAIAFDAGGVATGPMTVTFILSMAVGAAKSVENRNPLTDGFGMVSLVALTPILSVLILGLLYKRKANRKLKEG
jgi:hypothetical protein